MLFLIHSAWRKRVGICSQGPSKRPTVVPPVWPGFSADYEGNKYFKSHCKAEHPWDGVDRHLPCRLPGYTDTFPSILYREFHVGRAQKHRVLYPERPPLKHQARVPQEVEKDVDERYGYQGPSLFRSSSLHEESSPSLSPERCLGVPHLHEDRDARSKSPLKRRGGTIKRKPKRKN